MQKPSLLKHFRDILILPFTVTVILPYLLYNSQQGQQFNNIIFKALGALFEVGGLVLLYIQSFFLELLGKAHWPHGHRHKNLSSKGRTNIAGIR